jgi:NADH:ubiquinone oxidoreductase subunit F (NADH-binding)
MTINTIIEEPYTKSLSVGHYPGLTPRLVTQDGQRETLADYLDRGGYAPGLEGERLILAVEDSLLRGRGGAAFPMAVKLRALREQTGEKFAVANGEEGEPASIKDRWLLRNRPHLVLDGLFRTALAIEAASVFVYVSDGLSKQSIESALAELSDTPIAATVHLTEPSYVAGEETSVVRAINGGPAKPLDKPPRPFQSGVKDRPTLVSNVETLANIPFIATNGGEAFRSVGADTGSPGSFLMTVSGACLRPGLYEIPMGTVLKDAIENTAGFDGKPKAFLMGGFFAGLLGEHALELELTYDRLRAAGSGLGCGAIVILGEEDSPVAAAADVMAYFSRENAGQCGACIRGTDAMSKVVSDLAAGKANREAINKLRNWSRTLIGRGACNLLDGAASVAASLLQQFPEEVEAHLLGQKQVVLPESVSTISRFAINLRGGI